MLAYFSGNEVEANTKISLKNLFEWKKELFEWLYVYDKWNWEDKYPVIKIDFFWDLRSSNSIKASILNTLEKNQKWLFW